MFEGTGVTKVHLFIFFPDLERPIIENEPEGGVCVLVGLHWDAHVEQEQRGRSSIS